MTNDFEKKAFDMLSGMGADLDALACDDDPEKLYEYLDECLDVEFRCNSAKEYKSAKLYVTLGGPNVWVDTRNGEVAGAWGCDRESAWLASEVCEEIDEIFREWFACLRA